MERNSNETPTNHTPGQSGASGSGAAPLSGSGYGASSGSGSSGSTSSSSGSFGGDSGLNTGEIADRAKNALGGAREKAENALGGARDKAGNLKNSLADKLEAGAERLQQRGQGNQFASAGDGSASLEADNRLAQVTSSVATGMQSTADWLREADLDSLKEGVEQQVKEHPGRTLLIALGVGYLLGKAFRR
jgi:ElaB/YqjD/DUF883 family membrane-anchored ribosome-binding protein